MKRLAAILALVFGLVAIAALAQDDGDGGSDNGFILNMIQNRLSAPGRQIALSGVSGALSSQARVGRITISDDTGPWLRIDNVEFDWSRLALLRGRVAINRLRAGQITWLRRAVVPPAPRALPQAETKPFALPELPVSIQLADLQLDRVRFDEPVFGQAAELSVTGALNLVRGALDTTLQVKRLDGPGGALDLKAGFSNATRQLDVDLSLQEPKGGMVATLLKIEGKPAIDLEVKGSGPLDKVDVNFSLDADQQRLAQGLVALRSRDDGLGFDVSFDGGLSPLIPAQFRDFFAGQSTVRVQGVNKTAGGLRIDKLSLAGAVLKLDGGLETGPDGFLRSVILTGSLGDPSGPAVVLPVPGARTRLHSAMLHVNYGESDRWSGLLVLDRIEAADISMEDVTFRMGGLARNLDDPAKRNVTINVEGLATGVWAEDPEVARALGTRIDLFADAALKPGGPVTLNQFQVSGNGLSLFSAGDFADMVYTGRSAVRVDDLAIFAGIANRPISGAVDLHANGSVTPLSGGFDLALQGGTTDVAIGDARVDALLAGATSISGRAVRDQDGIRTQDLRIANPQISFASDGQISSKHTDIGFTASLANLALVDERLDGTLAASGHASGDGRPITVRVSASVPQGRLMDRTLTVPRVGFDGKVDGTNVTGSLSGTGTFDGLVLQLAGDIALVGQHRAVTGLDVAVGPNRLTGSVSKDGAAPAVGQLAIDAPEIAPVAALALIEASGSIDADIGLDAAKVGQGVSLMVHARDLAMGTNGIAKLDMQARIQDALGLPLIEGELVGRDLAFSGFEVASLHAAASQTDQNAMHFTADSRLAIGTLVDLSGDLARLDGGFAATLETLNLRQKAVAAHLTAPTTVTIRGSAVDLTPLNLEVGTGSLAAQGRIDETIDLGITIKDLPLAIANAIRPDLGLAGTVNGTATVSGSRAKPDIAFKLGAAGVASAATGRAGLPPVSLDATGTTAAGRLNLDGTVGSGNGLAARVKGSAPLGAGDLDFDVDLQAFPLALVDRAAGNRGLRGTVSGTAKVTGPLTDPAATFDLRGEGLTATMLSANGVPPFTLAATGSYRALALQLTSARATGAPGLNLEASGRIPFRGAGLDARVSGVVPLAMADPLLASRSAQVTGEVRVDATARGALAAPQLAGTVALQGGTAFDPATNLRFRNISLDAALDGRAAVLHSFRAESAMGGAVSAQGRVAFGPGYPADLTARLDNLRYTDGVFITTQLNGRLAVKGPLVGRGGMLSGQIDLGQTEISVEEGLSANTQAVLDQVTHYRAPSGVAATLKRAAVNGPRDRESSGRAGMGLDIRVSAPNRIFVRGRGLDVELGGELRVRGTTTEIQPVGQFGLRRGRLEILGQRIEFDEGSLQLVGNLDPVLNFKASTRSEDVTAIVMVQGRVSAPEITFSSEPPLPSDEVLARILFNRATADLSAFQLAQLAAAAADLAGSGGGPGILSQLRGATGLDDLDVITQENGATAVRAGKYVDENVYVDVQTDTEGVSRAEINLDLSRTLTARGSVASDGNTIFGLFFERDY